METFKNLVFQQAKEIAAGLALNPAQLGTKADSSSESKFFQLLSERLLPTISDGYIVHEPFGLFQYFIFKV
jgi:hypothetical protein